jgi:hypothetical protein
MVLAMVRDPLESAIKHLPKQSRGRYFHSSRWSYTLTGSGAVQLETSHFGDPGGHDTVLHRMEVDVVGTLGSTAALLHLEWDTGDYVNHSYLLDSWSIVGDEHHVIQLPTFPLPIPHSNGAHARLTIASGTADANVIIHGLFEWI